MILYHGANKAFDTIENHMIDLDSQERMTELMVNDDIEKPIYNFNKSRKEVKNNNGGFWLPDIEVSP